MDMDRTNGLLNDNDDDMRKVTVQKLKIAPNYISEKTIIKPSGKEPSVFQLVKNVIVNGTLSSLKLKSTSKVVINNSSKKNKLCKTGTTNTR